MTIKSAERALLILEVLAQHQPISMPELREKTDIPRSSLHGLMAVLVASNFATADERKRYSVGLKAFEVGATWLDNMSLDESARPVLRTLVQDLNQIAHLGVLDGTDIIYVMKQENESPVRLISAVGRRLPAHATALGKVLLGALKDEEIAQRYRGQNLPQLTPVTVTSLEELMVRVRAAREEGLSVDAGESTAGVTCYAAPIFDRNRQIIAALSVSVIDLDQPDFSHDHYAQKVKEAAHKITSLIGGS
jgi:IclR family KDG regulon transcriptional repressor